MRIQTNTRDVRCKDCNILLGKRDESGFVIRRGEIEVHYAGSGVISIRCYRRNCSALNVLQLEPASRHRGSAA